MKLSYNSTRLSCYIGITVQAIINNFLPIIFIIFYENYGLSYEKLGRIIFINFCVQIFADFAATKISDLIGMRLTAFLCQFLAALGLSLLCLLPEVMSDTYTAIIISVVFYAFGSGLMEVILSPIIEHLPLKNKGAQMSFLHSFYCWGQAFTVIGTTLLMRLTGFDNWNYIPLIWAVIPFLNCFAFLAVPIVSPEETNVKTPLVSLLKDKTFIYFMIFMLCAGASEISMAQWASIFAQQTLGVSKVMGDILGPCAFALFMGTGRIVFGMLSGKISTRKIFIANNILCTVCYFLVAFCKIPAAAFIGCAACGFSVCLSWPGTYSMASAKFLSAGTIMFSILALCGDLGCSVGPWLLGIVADTFGLSSGFAVCAVFPIVMVITALLVKEKDCKTK